MTRSRNAAAHISPVKVDRDAAQASLLERLRSEPICKIGHQKRKSCTTSIRADPDATDIGSRHLLLGEERVWTPPVQSTAVS
jgi:hypothetical protein